MNQYRERLICGYSSKWLVFFLSFFVVYHLTYITKLNAVTVDVYQDCESGNAGDALTPTIMNASNYGLGTWAATNGSLYVSENRVKRLPGTVTVRGGATYTDSGTRTWAVNSKYSMNYVTINMDGFHPNVTVACHFTPGPAGFVYNYFDTIAIKHPHSGVMSLHRNGSTPLHMELETCGGDVSCHVSLTDIPVVPGKTYWLCLNLNSLTNLCSLLVYDPDTWTQVGDLCTTWASAETCSNCLYINFGRQDNHGNNLSDESQSNFDNIMVDYTNGTFPLFPDIVTDTTPPGAPGVVRDGTGTDIDIAASSTQLSANWTVAVDNESSITSYQYAIGTTRGGTQALAWTTLGNVLTVTKTGLGLTAGVTYYFSVRAQSSGGTGNAANSDGQVIPMPGEIVPVVSLYFQDDFEWSNSTGSWDAITQPANHTIEVNTTVAMHGAKALHLNDSDTTNLAGAYLTKNFGVGLSTDVYVRFYMYFPTGYKAGGGSRSLLQVFSGSKRGIMFLQNNGSTNFRPYMQDSPSWGDATWSGSQDVEGQWYCIEMHVSAPAASTTLEFWQDGVKNTASLSGKDFSGSGVWDSIQFGDISNIWGAGGTGDFYLDCLVVSNSYIGPLSTTVDTSSPTPPGAVRDGTGNDVGSTTLATQLSANWDVASDSESSISRYEYAIGTVPGNTDITNGWLANSTDLTVTKAGLTLTAGTTYYFSVKAVNGAGLQSSAANSNGQYVFAISTTTPPPPPPQPAGGIRAYPNPVSFSGNNTVKFHVDDTKGADVSIYTLNGKPVRKVPAQGWPASGGRGVVEWDGTNEDGEKVTRGIYIYILTQGNDKITGKLAVTGR